MRCRHQNQPLQRASSPWYPTPWGEGKCLKSNKQLAKDLTIKFFENFAAV